MSAPTVEAVGLTKRFGAGARAVTALDGVDLAVDEGEFFTLLGPSGCGKTTLLRLIAGFEQPTSGDVRLAGRSVAGLLPHRRPVNTVFQSYALFPHLSVARNVAFGPEMRGVPRAEIETSVREALRLTRLDGLGDRRPAELSGGQQQRVALARALINRPKVLLLDEPLSALDLKLRKGMQLELKRLRGATGVTFVFVTHDQTEALTMSDRIAVMDGGRVLQVGTPAEVYDRPSRRFVADFIGEANLLTAADAGPDGVFRLEGGGELRAGDDRPPGARTNGAAVTLAVRPERAELDAADAPGCLPARVEEVVYAGEATQVFLRLEGGQPFRVRLANRDGAAAGLAAGASVGLRVPAAAVRVLED